MLQIKEIAELIEPLPLTIADKFIFSIAPVSQKNPTEMSYLYQFAKARAHGESCILGDMVTLPKNAPSNTDDLHSLEVLHKVIISYLWLSYVPILHLLIFRQRMSDTFIDQPGAMLMKSISESHIQHALLHLKFSRKSRNNKRLERIFKDFKF
jgi:ATP-dependent RNA helicase SUPV3L1/SUV3